MYVAEYLANGWTRHGDQRHATGIPNAIHACNFAWHTGLGLRCAAFIRTGISHRVAHGHITHVAHGHIIHAMKHGDGRETLRCPAENHSKRQKTGQNSTDYLFRKHAVKANCPCLFGQGATFSLDYCLGVHASWLDSVREYLGRMGR